MANNVLNVVQGHDHPLLQSANLKAQNASWVAGRSPEVCAHYGAKTRYRQADAGCLIDTPIRDIAADEFRLTFDQRQWAITPGQSAVLYDGEICLGGGIIV